MLKDFPAASQLRALGEGIGTEVEVTEPTNDAQSEVLKVNTQ